MEEDEIVVVCTSLM